MAPTKAIASACHMMVLCGRTVAVIHGCGDNCVQCCTTIPLLQASAATTRGRGDFYLVCNTLYGRAN